MHAASLHMHAASLHMHATSLHMHAASLHMHAASLHMHAPSLHMHAASLHMHAARFISAPHGRNIVSVHNFIWSLCVKGDCSSFRIKKSSVVQHIPLFSQCSGSSAIFIFCFTACFSLDSGQPFLVFLMNELFMSSQKQGSAFSVISSKTT